MFAIVPEFVHPPSLASSLSEFHAEVPFEQAMLLDGPTPPAAVAPAGVQSSLDAQKFVRHHELGKDGVYLTIGGMAVTVVGGVVAAASCSNANQCSLLVPTLIVGAGDLATTVGGVLMFVGGIEAAYDGRRLGLPLSPTVGWVGVALLGASDVLSWTYVGSTGSDASITWPAVGEALGLAGLICGAVQLGEDGHQGRKKGVIAEVVPTPHGLVVAGSF